MADDADATANWAEQQRHYDNYAKKNQFESKEQAIAARESGAGLPLKKFHNGIKKQLLHRFAFRANRLLDLCCGRGGDMHKWAASQVLYVKGLDISGSEVEEAKRRYEELQQGRRGPVPLCEFYQSEALGGQPVLEAEGQLYDVVTCMFAIHYFFVREEALRTFLANVAENLNIGGYFLGTVPDGKRVVASLAGQSEFCSPMLKLAKRWKGELQCFGSAYTCSIADTVTQSDEESDGSLEYLVFSNAFVAVAAQVGLYPVVDYEDPDLEAQFDPEDAQALLKHFHPSFPGSDPSLEQASALFTAFVFQRLERDPNDPNAPLPVGRAPPPRQGSKRPGGAGNRGDGQGHGRPRH